MRECERLLYRRTGHERSTSKRKTEHEHFQSQMEDYFAGYNMVHEEIGLTSALGRHIMKDAKQHGPAQKRMKWVEENTAQGERGLKYWLALDIQERIKKTRMNTHPNNKNTDYPL